MVENQPNGDYAPPLSPLSTDLCLHLVEAGSLTLRDIQTCSVVSKHWRETWQAAIRRSPYLFLKAFFPHTAWRQTFRKPSSLDSVEILQRNPDGLSEEELRERRCEIFERRMRRQLANMMDSCKSVAVSPEMPRGVLPKFGAPSYLQSKAMSTLQAPMENRFRGQFLYHNGLVAWALDGEHFVVDNLREVSWQLFSVDKHGEHGWQYRHPEVTCLTDKMLVTVSSPMRSDMEQGAVRSVAEVFVHNLKTGCQIKFQHTEALGLQDSGVTFHALDHDIVTLCSSNKRIVRYRMDWGRGAFFDAGDGDSFKVNEVKLPHPNHSHIFFDNHSTDTIFAVCYEEKQIVINEYLHCDLQTAHQASTVMPKEVEDLKPIKHKTCVKADSHGNIELLKTDGYKIAEYLSSITTFYFNIPLRRFEWRNQMAVLTDTTHWNGWAYFVHKIDPKVQYVKNQVPWVRVEIIADQCHWPTAAMDRMPTTNSLGRMVYRTSEEVSMFLLGKEKGWSPKMFVDDEFIVFAADGLRGPYCVLSRKYGEDVEEDTILHRV